MFLSGSYTLYIISGPNIGFDDLNCSQYTEVASALIALDCGCQESYKRKGTYLERLKRKLWIFNLI